MADETLVLAVGNADWKADRAELDGMRAELEAATEAALAAIEAVDLTALSSELGLVNDGGAVLIPGLPPGRILVAAFQDPDGVIVGGVLDDGSTWFRKVHVGEQLVGAGKVTLDFRDSNALLAVGDEDGHAKSIVPLHGDARGWAPAAELAARDAQNRTLAAERLARRITNLAALQPGYNLVVVGGQSNATGVEAYGPLSTTTVDGNLMWGGDTRSASVGAGSFTPKGGAAFNPLKAQVLDGAGNVLDDAAIDALAQGSQVVGEDPVVSTCNILKRLSNRRLAVAADATRTLVGVNVGVGGRSIDELKQGHGLGSVEYWDIFDDAMDQTATAAGATPHQLLAYVFIQGETEYLQGTSGDVLTTLGNRADRKAALADFHADVNAKAAATGNARPPAFGVVTVGGAYTRDIDPDGDADLWVAMADLEYCRETEGAFQLLPYYPYADKTNHLTANGVRNLGLKAGLILHRIVSEGRDWEPLAPLAVELSASGRTIDLHLATTSPLQFAPSYMNGVGYDFADKGLRASDAAGSAAIASVAIVAPSVVRVQLGRALERSTGRLWYADQTGYAGAPHNGLGNICDSERTDPLELFKYLDTVGMYGPDNIAALIDRPYDMRNWLVPFHLPMGYLRS